MLPTLFVTLALGHGADDQAKKFEAQIAKELAREAVRKVLDDQVAAWNKGDLDGFMKGYWDSPELFFISGGKSVQGFKALKERYDTNYRGDGKEMGKLTFSEVHVEPLSPDAALVRGKWQVETKKETVGGWYTLLFRKLDGGWKITHDHTSK